MPCKRCDNYRDMLRIARQERDHYKNKIDAANKALFFAQELINELEAKRQDPDILKTCIAKLKILIPRAEEPGKVIFKRGGV